jgi:hypothetical protein
VLLGGATVTIDTKSRFITISLPDVATTRTFRCPGLGALNDWSADIMKLTTEEELFTVARTLLVSALSTLTLCQTIWRRGGWMTVQETDVEALTAEFERTMLGVLGYKPDKLWMAKQEKKLVRKRIVTGTFGDLH